MSFPRANHNVYLIVNQVGVWLKKKGGGEDRGGDEGGGPVLFAEI